MSQEVKKEKKFTMTLPAEELMACGHLACQGCGATLAMRYMLKALGPEDHPLHPGLLLGRHRRALSLLVHGRAHLPLRLRDGGVDGDGGQGRAGR